MGVEGSESRVNAACKSTGSVVYEWLLLHENMIVSVSPVKRHSPRRRTQTCRHTYWHLAGLCCAAAAALGAHADVSAATAGKAPFAAHGDTGQARRTRRCCCCCDARARCLRAVLLCGCDAQWWGKHPTTRKEQAPLLLQHLQTTAAPAPALHSRVGGAAAGCDQRAFVVVCGEVVVLVVAVVGV